MRPDTSDGNITLLERRVYENLMIGELGFDESFPEVVPEGVIKFEENIDRLDFISKLSDADDLGLNKSTVTVKTHTPVACLRIKRIDFARFMRWEMFCALEKGGHLYRNNVLSL
jgi:hypothetical protein